MPLAAHTLDVNYTPLTNVYSTSIGVSMGVQAAQQTNLQNSQSLDKLPQTAPLMAFDGRPLDGTLGTSSAADLGVELKIRRHQFELQEQMKEYQGLQREIAEFTDIANLQRVERRLIDQGTNLKEILAEKRRELAELKQVVSPGFNRWKHGEPKVKIKFNQIKKSARALELPEDDGRAQREIHPSPSVEAYGQFPDIVRPNFASTPSLEKAKVNIEQLRARRKNIATPPYRLDEDDPRASHVSSGYYPSPNRQARSQLKILESMSQPSFSAAKPVKPELRLPDLKDKPIRAHVAGNPESLSAFGIRVQNELNRVEGVPPLQQRALVQKQTPAKVPLKGRGALPSR